MVMDDLLSLGSKKHTMALLSLFVNEVVSPYLSLKIRNDKENRVTN